MAAHLSIRRIPSVFLLALLGLAIAAGMASYMSRPEPETAQVSRIAATAPVVTPLAETLIAELPQIAVGEAEIALAPGVEDEIALAVDAEDEAALDPDFEAVIVVAVEPAMTPVAAPVVSPVAAPVADPVAPPLVAPPVASGGRVTVARLAVEPQVSPGPRDPAVSILRPKNMAPIPKRAPRPATAVSNTARSAATLFQSGTEIRVKKDASVFITARNIPDNDRLLEAYSAERPNGGRVQTRLGEAAAVPGLLGIAAQAHRTQSNSQGAPAYSLADAMRDAIWRKNTAARLKSLTTALNACAESAGGIAKNAPSIGLSARC